jgi:glyoxylase I family protein
MRLHHAAVMTSSLDDSLQFYTELLGLRLRVVEPDPIRKGRRRAILIDDEELEVLELIEMPEMSHPVVPGRGGIHHLGFRLARRDWQALRSRMDAASCSYHEVDDRLFVRDRDGLVIEIEQSAP